MFTTETIDRIRTLNIESVISKYVELKKTGSTLKGLSPFTQEKTPSFTVSPAKNMYKCFSTGKGGDAIDFVMNHLAVPFYKAIEEIGNNNGVELEKTNWSAEKNKAYKDAQNDRRELQIVLNWATNWFMEQTAPQDFIKYRFNSTKEAQAFKIGYAPNKPNAIAEAGIKAQFTYEQLIKAGLIIDAKGKHYDYFQHRCIIPTLDHHGNTVGFTGRIVEDEKQYPEFNKQKYKYSNGTVWTKSDYLFGLPHALKNIQAHDELFLVEGQIDAITIFRKGIKNVLAIGSSSISDNQLKVLQRLTKNIILIPDNDGLKAKEKVAELGLKDTLKNRLKNNPGIKAMHRNAELLIKNGFEVNVVVPTLNKIADVDPDDLFKKLRSEAQISKFLATGQRYIDEALYNECFELAKDSPVDRADQVKRLGKVIDLIPDDINRTAYYDEVAKVWDIFKKSYKLKKGKDDATLKVLQSIKKENQQDFLEGGYFEENGSTWVASGSGDGKKQIAKFTIELPYFIQSSMTPGYIAILKKPNGASSQSFLDTKDINSKGKFKDFTSRQKCVYKGTDAHIDNIIEHKSETSISCQSIPVMGQIKEYYAFANGVYYDNKFFTPNKYGVVHIEMPITSIEELESMYDGSIIKHNDKEFSLPNAVNFVEEVGQDNIQQSINENKLFYYNNLYIPMAHKGGHDSLDDPYADLKKFRYNQEATLKFSKWSTLMHEVYSDNAILGIGFACMSVFRDIIYKSNQNFVPSLFCFGPRKKGKSTFSRSLMFLFGSPSEDDGINLEMGSTATGINRSLASYRNAIVWMNEFKNPKNPADNKVIGMLKGISDGSGKKTGLKTNDNATRQVTPHSTAIISGQDLPQETGLLSRIITLEFDGSHFGTPEKYEELDDLQNNTEVSNVLVELLAYRKVIKKQYKATYKLVKAELQNRVKEKGVAGLTDGDRFFLTISSVVAPLLILRKEDIGVPWSEGKIYEVATDTLVKMREVESQSQESDTFFSILRELTTLQGDSGISIGQHIDIDGNELRIRYAEVFQKYVKEALKQRIDPFSKPQLKKYLEQHESYKEYNTKYFKAMKGSYKCMIFDYDILKKNDVVFERPRTSTENFEAEAQTETPTEEVKQGNLPF